MVICLPSKYVEIMQQLLKINRPSFNYSALLLMGFVRFRWLDTCRAVPKKNTINKYLII